MAASQSHHLNSNHAIATIECESGGDSKAVGDGGLSHGLVQIYEPAHPDITRAQAEDPEFAIEFMAKAWEEDHAAWWTCHRQLEAKYGIGDWPIN